MMKVNEIRMNEEAFEKLGVCAPKDVYAAINNEGDCVLNGWIDKFPAEENVVRKVKVEAAICNEHDEIMARQASFKALNQVHELGYEAFTIVFRMVNRYFDPEDIAFIKLYPVLEDE